MEEDLGGGGTTGSSEPVKEVSMLEKYGILRKDESKLLRELINKYNKKGILSTTCSSGIYSSMKFLQISIVRSRSLKTQKENCAKLLRSDALLCIRFFQYFLMMRMICLAPN